METSTSLRFLACFSIAMLCRVRREILSSVDACEILAVLNDYPISGEDVNCLIEEAFLLSSSLPESFPTENSFPKRNVLQDRDFTTLKPEISDNWIDVGEKCDVESKSASTNLGFKAHRDNTEKKHNLVDHRRRSDSIGEALYNVLRDF